MARTDFASGGRESPIQRIAVAIPACPAAAHIAGPAMLAVLPVTPGAQPLPGFLCFGCQNVPRRPSSASS